MNAEPVLSPAASWPREGRYLVAVSGGLDSMVLWHALEAAGYRDLVVVHVDHGLRGAESEADAAFVRSEAERRGVPCVVRKVATADFAKDRKLSLETAARELRYGAIAAVARELDRPSVFLAHHADDRAETVLLHLFRGAGSRGLAGMAAESRRRVGDIELTLLRPLLRVSRERIAAYAAEQGIPWREDASNTSDFALRNRIRHRVLPEIDAAFGRDARAALLRAADLAALDEAWAGQVLGDLPHSRDGRGLDVAALRALPAAPRQRLLLAWLRESGVPDCGLAEVERTCAVLLATGRPAKASLPGGHQVRRRAGVLFLEGPDPG